MKRLILLSILLLVALSPLAYTQEIGGASSILSPVKFGGKKLPSWLSSEYSPIFNGVNASAIVATNSIPFGENTTMMFWYNQTIPNGYSYVLSSSDGAMYCYPEAPNKIRFRYGNLNFSTPNNSISIGVWTHVTFVKSAATQSIYLDGVLSAETAASSPYSAPNVGIALGNVYSLNSPMACKMAELSIWNRALTQSEILKYKDKRLKGTETGIVALYHMNDNSSTMVDSVAGKNAIATNTVWTKRNGFQPPDVRSERWAISMDGTDDFASGTNTQISTYPFSFESWSFCYPDTKYVDCFGIGDSATSTINSVFFTTLYTAGTNYVWLRRRVAGADAGQINHLDLGLVNKWYHVACVLEAHNLAKMYINGIQVGTNTESIPSIGNVGSIILGRQTWAGGTYGRAKFIETRFWNTARTQAEIQTNMYQQMTGSETGLVYYYRGNEGTGSTLTNLGSAGSAGNLTLYNSPTWTGRDIP